jgi:hypothetical protein
VENKELEKDKGLYDENGYYRQQTNQKARPVWQCLGKLNVSFYGIYLGNYGAWKRLRQ